MYAIPTVPPPPGRLITVTGLRDSLSCWITLCSVRPTRSSPPPGALGTTISTGRCGCHASAALAASVCMHSRTVHDSSTAPRSFALLIPDLPITSSPDCFVFSPDSEIEAVKRGRGKQLVHRYVFFDQPVGPGVAL